MANMREVQQNWAEITQQLLSEPDVYLQFLQFSSHLYGLPFPMRRWCFEKIQN